MVCRDGSGPKEVGKVRICVDLKTLNDNVLREVYPMKVDKTLAQLKGVHVFSKLDANSGFWQIPLAPESRPLTTFITPYGHYHFNKLPFWYIKCPQVVSEMYGSHLGGSERSTMPS